MSVINQLIHDLVTTAKLPLMIHYDGEVYYKIISRSAYFDNLATNILKNDTCSFVFEFNNVRLEEKYPIGVSYDISQPESLPWEIFLKKKKGTRVDIAKIFTNSVKFSEYLTNGKISHISNMSVKENNSLTESLKHCNLEKLDGIMRPLMFENSGKIAVRYHFKNGSSRVTTFDLNEKQTERTVSSVFGVCQGIILKLYSKQSIIFLKSFDNWLHIALPLADLNFEKETLIRVNFIAVAGASVLKNSTIDMQSSVKVKDCQRYLNQQLSPTNSTSTNYYIYKDGLFLVDNDEFLRNILFPNEKRLLLYYSKIEAWN